MSATAKGEVEIVLRMSESAMNAQVLAAQTAAAKSSTDNAASHERQVMSQLALERKRFVAEGLANEVAALDQVVAMRKKAYDYKSQGFSQERATGMARQEVLYDTEIAAKQKAAELAKSIEASQASLNAQKLKELETARQIAEKQSAISAANGREQLAIQKKIKLMAAVAAGDNQRESHLKAMAALERNVQLGLNAGLKPSEALQQARTMLRLEQNISQEKQKQQSIGGGKGGDAYSGARRGPAFAGGQNAASRVGMLSQQAQDVAVSLQMGMSANRVIAQQGSQIASIFGSKGRVIGGVIAIGAAIYEWAANTKAAEKAAEEYKKVLDETSKIAEKNAASRIEIASKIAGALGGQEAGERSAEELKYSKELNEIHQKEIALLATIADKKRRITEDNLRNARDTRPSRIITEKQSPGVIRALSGEESQLIELATRKKQMAEEINVDRSIRAKKKEDAVNFATWSTGEQIKMLSIESEQEKKYAQLEHEFKSDLVQIEMSDETALQKIKRTNAAENLYAAKLEIEAKTEEAKIKKKDQDQFMNSPDVKVRAEAIKNERKLQEQGETHADKLLSISEKIGALNMEKLSIGMTEARGDEIRLALSKLELERSAAMKDASEDIVKKANEEYNFAASMNAIVRDTSATRLEVLREERALLDKKIAWTPNEIALLNAQKVKIDQDIQKQQRDGLIAAGGAGMGVVAQQMAADKAQEKALNRARKNLGLGQIKRGMSGEIIGGVNLDPNSGKVGESVGPEEIARRQRLLGVVAGGGNLPVPANAVFDQNQIKAISDGIALAVFALITK